VKLADADIIAVPGQLADFVLKLESQRPACVPEQPLSQLDHLLRVTVGLFDFPMINPLGEPGRLRPIDPLYQPSQTDDSIDEKFLDGIARSETEFPGACLILIVSEIFGRQDHEVRPASVVECVQSRPILALLRVGASVLLSISAIRFDLRSGDHGDLLSFESEIGQNALLPKFWGTAKLLETGQRVIISKINYDLVTCGTYRTEEFL
jgi:hypothetical protein